MMKSTGVKSSITVTVEAARISITLASLYLEKIGSDSWTC
jgi:hypothetical protein